MSFIYKTDILKTLKANGYNTNRIRKEKIIGESMLQKLRNGEMVSWGVLDKICTLLECDVGDIIQHTKCIDDKTK